MGSVTGSVISAFLVIASREWWLRFLDKTTYIGDFRVPLLKTGFRMVVFSVILMVVVLFFRTGIMGDKELTFEGIGGWLKKHKKPKPVPAEKVPRVPPMKKVVMKTVLTRLDALGFSCMTLA